MTRAGDWASFAGYTAVLATAVAASRLSRRPVLFGPMLSGRKAIILRHLAQQSGARSFRAIAPRSDRRPMPTLRRLTPAVTRRLLRHADPRRLAFAIWGYSDSKRLGVDLAAEGFAVHYIEAGLLGFQEAKREPVVSFTHDRRRQYFDGRGSSDLEELLNGLDSGWWRRDSDLAAFEAAARRSDLQKYTGIDGAPETRLGPDDVLVLGQVEGDAAWTCTVTTVDDNLALVRRVVQEFGGRRRIFYKPHPYNPSNEAQLAALAREGLPVEIVPAGVSFRALARMGPTVAVNTSGAGLEAAFLGCRVVSYGASYYAGWGVTEDRFPPIARRRNRLTAEDIYVAVMALYCRYFFRADLRPAKARDITPLLSTDASRAAPSLRVTRASGVPHG